MSGVRWGQTFLFGTVTIMTIVNCCSAPINGNINFLAEAKNSNEAVNPISRLNKLQLGMTGFCNKNQCISYREYTTNPEKAASKTKLTSKERPVIEKISGKGEALTGKVWLSLSVLNGFAVFAAVIGTAIGLVLARSDKYANFDPTGDQREQSLVNGMRYTFVGLVFVNFALLVGAFSLAHVKFTNSKEQLVKAQLPSAYGISWYLAMIAMILSIGIACLEGLYVSMTASRIGKQNTAGGGGYAGGGGGGYGDEYY